MKKTLYFLLIVCSCASVVSLPAMEKSSPDKKLLLLATEEVSSESVQKITDILQKEKPSDDAIVQATEVTRKRLEALVGGSGVGDKIFDSSGNDVNLNIGEQHQDTVQRLSLMLDSLIEQDFENGKNKDL